VQILLHCGHFKTGTTAFQSELRRHRDALLAAGVFVPDAHKGNHGYLLNPRKPERFCATAGPLRDELQRAQAEGARYAVLSAELMAHLTGAQLESVRDVLRPWPVLPLLVLRPWRTSLLSRYGQNVASGDWQSFPEWLNSLTAPGQRHPDADYALVVRRLRQAFGVLVVAPYEYDAARKWLTSVVTDNPRLLPPNIDAPRSENTSKPWLEREMLRAVNAVIGGALGRQADAKHLQGAGCHDGFTALLLRPWLEKMIDEQPAWIPLLRERLDRSRREYPVRRVQSQIERWDTALQDELAHPDITVRGGQRWLRFSAVDDASAQWSGFSIANDQPLRDAVLMHWRRTAEGK